MRDQPPPSDSPMEVVVGPLIRMPTRVLLRAVELARENGAEGLSEAHLVCALLESSKLQAALEEASVPFEALRQRMVSELPRDAPPNLEVRQRDDGGYEVGQYGMVEMIEGRAGVLAAAAHAHNQAPIDLFVAALFDPKSLTTYVLSSIGADRGGVIKHLADRFDRYRGIAFPGTSVTTLSLPLRLPWSRREEVVELLSGSIPEGVSWTFAKDGDDMLLRWSDDVVERTLRDHGLA